MTATVITATTTPKAIDPAHEAEKILREHSEGVMSCCTMEFESTEEMLERTIKECAFILTNKLLEGKFTPLQFNAVRNELSRLLWDIFTPAIKEEGDAALKAFRESLL